MCIRDSSLTSTVCENATGVGRRGKVPIRVRIRERSGSSGHEWQRHFPQQCRSWLHLAQCGTMLNLMLTLFCGLAVVCFDLLSGTGRSLFLRRIVSQYFQNDDGNASWILRLPRAQLKHHPGAPGCAGLRWGWSLWILSDSAGRKI